MPAQSLMTETFGHVMVVHTPDELTEDVAADFVNALGQSLANGQKHFVLEMDRTEQYDSAGLSALLDLRDRVRESLGTVKVSGLNETGRKVFEVVRLNQYFDVFDSLIDAVSSFR